MNDPLEILREFLKLQHTAEAVMEKFADLQDAQYVESRPNNNDGFVYIPPKRSNALLLIAHADVYRINYREENQLVEDEYKIQHSDGLLGADDRAGCALLWLFRQSGHGLLVTDGEEIGMRGSIRLLSSYPEIGNAIDENYPFLVEFDTNDDQKYKCYNVGTAKFCTYIEEKTGFSELDSIGGTDICVLARHCCGVNFSCGYHNAHTKEEYIVKAEWLHTFDMAKRLLAEPKYPRFDL